ncbi:anthranilate synthase component I family protein, partial [Micromonospora sp. KC723]
MPDQCRGVLIERDRREWTVTQGGDPAALVETFLAAHGLDLTDLARPAVHDPDGVCGAALFVSATAGAVMAGGAAGPPSPVPGLPDIAVVVYDHGPAAARG